jgi:hypothetical protein
MDSKPITWVTSAWVCQRHDKWTTGDPIEGCCGLIPPTHWVPLPEPPLPSTSEADMEMVLRTRKRMDEFVAHLDEGGKFSAQNILELIADAQELGNRLEHRAQAKAE